MNARGGSARDGHRCMAPSLPANGATRYAVRAAADGRTGNAAAMGRAPARDAEAPHQPGESAELCVMSTDCMRASVHQRTGSLSRARRPGPLRGRAARPRPRTEGRRDRRARGASPRSTRPAPAACRRHWAAPDRRARRLARARTYRCRPHVVRRRGRRSSRRARYGRAAGRDGPKAVSSPCVTGAGRVTGRTLRRPDESR